jgi:hypothetical protein
VQRRGPLHAGARHGRNGGSTVSPATAKRDFWSACLGTGLSSFLHAPLSHLIRGPVSGDLTIDKVQSLACIMLQPANWNVLRRWLGVF